MGNEYFWTAALNQSSQALEHGALIPLTTSRLPCPGPGGEQFELRQLNARLPRHHRPEGPKPNPFSPWDPELEIDSIGGDHVLILNKYPVQTGHLLLITRQWASQVHWLTHTDWNALVRVDRDTSGLWFFNSGPKAGASQPHRHLQLLRRQSGEKTCPRESWFLHILEGGNTVETAMSRDPLIGSCAVVQRPNLSDPEQESRALHDLYRSLAMTLALGDADAEQPPRAPYNLLLTPKWMALIRRKKERASGFSLNALGFAGYLLATQNSDLGWLEHNGGERLLQEVVSRISDATDDSES